jgi:hypothetical protein
MTGIVAESENAFAIRLNDVFLSNTIIEHHMKFVPYIFMLFLISGIQSSCKKLDELVSFNLDTRDTVRWIGIPDTVLTDTFNNNEGFILLSEEFKFSDYAKFATNKTTPAQIEDVQALNFTLELTDDSISNYSFCKNLEIYLMSPNNAFPEILIYENEFPVPTQSSFVAELEGNNSEFLKAIQKNDYQFKAQFILQNLIPDTITMNMQMSFRLKGNPND